MKLRKSDFILIQVFHLKRKTVEINQLAAFESAKASQWQFINVETVKDPFK